LIYPVPDPNFPFLGVHFTRMMKGGVEAGPNAVFAFKKEGYKKTDFSLNEVTAALAWPGFRKVMMKYWRTGLGEYYRSFSKTAFTQALQN
jgi:L-2-hydroxyglutarate oxidase